MWTSAVILFAAVAYLIVMSRRPGPAPQPNQPDRVPGPAVAPPVEANMTTGPSPDSAALP